MVMAAWREVVDPGHRHRVVSCSSTVMAAWRGLPASGSGTATAAWQGLSASGTSTAAVPACGCGSSFFPLLVGDEHDLGGVRPAGHEGDPGGPKTDGDWERSRIQIPY
jgi:hypothetical protein